MDTLGILQRLGQGKFVDEVCDALATTSAEVVATRNSGTVSITLKIEPAPGDEAMVIISEKIKRSSPSPKPAGAFMYAVDGELFREDPRQTKMELRAVDGSAELRVADDPGKTLREA